MLVKLRSLEARIWIVVAVKKESFAFNTVSIFLTPKEVITGAVLQLD